MNDDRSGDSSGGDQWARHLAIAADGSGDDRPMFTMPLSGHHLNFLEGAHGGALFSLAETAVREAARRDGDGPRLVDAHLVLTAGGTEGDTFTATVEPVNVGRTLAVYRVAVTRADGRLVGEFTGTVRFDT